MKNNNVYRFSILAPIILLFFIFVVTQQGFDNSWNIFTTDINDLNTTAEKQKGAHVFGKIDSANFEFLTRNNIEWITLVPWADQKDYDSPQVRHHNGDSTMILERDSSWLRRLRFVHSEGFKVFVKPHVWIHAPSDGKWRSDIFPTSEENWEQWKKSYREFILRYASLAEQTNVEMFCVGTEFSRLSLEKPAFWKNLIQEVRAIYSGKITYAANWYQEYEQITFWKDLDYIGIQTYFPLVDNKYPTVKEISKGWDTHLSSIEAIHKQYERAVIFTEIGYKSTADSAIKPWEWLDYSGNQGKSFSAATQANCYEAFFNTVWAKDWLMGAHIWQMRSDYKNGKNHGTDLNFTPLGKPAETVIAKGFE